MKMATELLLASSRGLEGTVAWVASSGKVERVFRAPEGPPFAAASVHSLLYSVRANKELLVHNLTRTDPVLRTTVPSREAFLCLVVSPSEEYLLGTAASGRFYLWHLPSGCLLATQPAHFGPVRAAAWLYDSASFVTASDDATCKTWSVANVVPRASSAAPTPVLFSGHALGVSAVVALPGRQVAISGGADRHACVWCTTTGAQLASIAMDGGVSALAVSPSGASMYCAVAPVGHVNVVNMSEVFGAVGDGVAVVAEGAATTLDVGVGVRPPRLGDSSVRSGSGGASGILAPHGAAITSLAVSHDGRHLATAGTDGRVVIWSLPSGRATSSLDGSLSEAGARAPAAKRSRGGGVGSVCMTLRSDPLPLLKTLGGEKIGGQFGAGGSPGTLATAVGGVTASLAGAAGQHKGVSTGDSLMHSPPSMGKGGEVMDAGEVGRKRKRGRGEAGVSGGDAQPVAPSASRTLVEQLRRKGAFAKAQGGHVG